MIAARCTSCPQACIARSSTPRVRTSALGPAARRARRGRRPRARAARPAAPGRRRRRARPRRRSGRDKLGRPSLRPGTSGSACNRCRSSTASDSSAARAASQAARRGTVSGDLRLTCRCVRSSTARSRHPRRRTRPAACPACPRSARSSSFPRCGRSCPLRPRLTPTDPKAHKSGGRCRPDEPGDAGRVCGRPLAGVTRSSRTCTSAPRKPARRDGRARQPVGVGGVEELGERGDLHRLRQHRRGPGPADVVQDEPRRGGRAGGRSRGSRPAAGTASSAAADGHPMQVQPVGQQARVDAVHADVGVAEADVELDRQPQLDRGHSRCRTSTWSSRRRTPLPVTRQPARGRPLHLRRAPDAGGPSRARSGRRR